MDCYTRPFLCLFFCLIVASGQAQPVPANAKKLINNYSNFILDFADNHIIFKDKTTMVWDDGIKNKTQLQLLNNPDLEDMFFQEYAPGKSKVPLPANYDPGRIRNIAFFEKIYGNTPKLVERNLVTITWCPKTVGQKIRVTKINGVDKKLMTVSKELDNHPELKGYVSNIGGTYNWRDIKGTTRHSMHSFGMTIDLNIKFSNYWQWECRCTNESVTVPYKNRIPQIIIDIFEKHGFIWGGKWSHFDTMHFEYRPELL